MFCMKCKTEKPEDPSEKRWCSECRKAARVAANEFRHTHPKKLYGGRSYASRDMILAELGFSSYREYLASPLWRSIRNRVFAAKGRRCYLCGREAWTVHHNRYHKNDLLGKHLMFVFPVCDEHHEHIEFSKNGKKVDLNTAKERFRQVELGKR